MYKQMFRIFLEFLDNSLYAIVKMWLLRGRPRRRTNVSMLHRVDRVYTILILSKDNGMKGMYNFR